MSWPKRKKMMMTIDFQNLLTSEFSTKSKTMTQHQIDSTMMIYSFVVRLCQNFFSKTNYDV